MRNIQFRQEVDQFEYILGFGQKDRDEWMLLRESLKMMESVAAKNRKTMVGLFDEFGDVKKLDGDRIVKLFRSELQLQANTVCLFAGSYESVMNTIFISRSAPFYRYARIIRLGRIDQELFRRHLTGVFEENQLMHADGLANEITAFTQGHPYYTSLMAQLAIVYRFDGPIQELTEMALESEGNYLEKAWSEISARKQEKAVILALAQNPEALLYQQLDPRKINIGRVLAKLKGSGFLEAQPNGYRFTDPLLQEWIRSKVLQLPGD
jgi:hypothetical protein